VPWAWAGAYSATKGAVRMFSQVSREVASRGITVNNVQPGPIDKDLNTAAGEWAAPQKPPQRSTAMGMLMRSPPWWRSSPVRSPRTYGANLTVMADNS